MAPMWNFPERKAGKQERLRGVKSPTDPFYQKQRAHRAEGTITIFLTQLQYWLALMPRKMRPHGAFSVRRTTLNPNCRICLRNTNEFYFGHIRFCNYTSTDIQLLQSCRIILSLYVFKVRQKIFNHTYSMLYPNTTYFAHVRIYTYILYIKTYILKL